MTAFFVFTIPYVDHTVERQTFEIVDLGCDTFRTVLICIVERPVMIILKNISTIGIKLLTKILEDLAQFGFGIVRIEDVL